MDLSGLFNRDPHINPYHEALQTGLANYQNAVNAGYAQQKLISDIRYKNALSDIIGQKVIPMLAQNQVLYGTGKGNNPAPNKDNSGNDNNQQPNNTSGTGNKGWMENVTDWVHDLFKSPPSESSASTPSKEAQTEGYETIKAPDNWDINTQGIPPKQNNNANPDRGYAKDAQGNNIVGNPDDVQPGVGQGAPAQQTQAPQQVAPAPTIPREDILDLSDPSMNAYNKDYGSKQANIQAAKINPSAAQEAKKQAIIERNKKMAELQTSQEAAIRDDANEKAKASTLLSQDEEAFMNVLENEHPLFVGPGLGKLAPIGPSSSKLVNLSSDMQTQMAAMLFGSKTTDAKERLAGTLKLNPEMPKPAIRATFDRIHAGQSRTNIYPDFVDHASKLGLKGANIDRQWVNYNLDMPPFNYKTGEILTKNNDRFKEYLNNAVGDKRIKVDHYQPKEKAEEILRSLPAGTKMVHMRNAKGVEFNVPVEKILDALNRNYYQVK